MTQVEIHFRDHKVQVRTYGPEVIPLSGGKLQQDSPFLYEENKHRQQIVFADRQDWRRIFGKLRTRSEQKFELRNKV